MAIDKEREFAFTDGDKESIQMRLKSLFKGRSLRQASIDWGLPYSTLNNYFSKGATPGLDVVIRIASIEKVPLSWLATGCNDFVLIDEAHRSTDSNAPLSSLNVEGSSIGFTATPLESNPASDLGTSLAWNMIYNALSQEERGALINLFMKVGAKGILEKMQENSDADLVWGYLNPEEKDRLIRLNDQLKKGSQEPSRGVAESDLSSDNKKAG